MPRQYRSLYDDFFTSVSKTDQLKKEMDALSSQMHAIIQENNQTEDLPEVSLHPVIAQDKMLQSLRHFLQNKPTATLRSVLVCGPKGVGKHSAIRQETLKAYLDKHVQHKEPLILNLALYQDIQLFYQDIYGLLNEPQAVIVLENLTLAPPSLQRALGELISQGSLSLPKRYLANQGKLVEASQVLDSQLISRLYAKGQWLILVEDLTRDQAISRLGNQLTSTLDRVFEASPLDLKTRQTLLSTLLQQLTSEHPQLEISASAYKALEESYDPQEGMHSYLKVLKQLDKWLQSRSGKLRYANGQWWLDDQLLSPDLVTDYALADELDQIVGLQEVKDYLFNLDQLVTMNERRQRQGLKTTPLNLHMIFSGNPGTGKTTIARLFGRYLKSKGLVSNGQLIEVARQDLVASYAGQTAPKTKAVIDASLGGILFIDEAYSLYRGKEDSFGLEAIDTLVKYMEDYRDQFVCILAGYEKEMQTFLTANSGLASRFSRTLHFADYSPSELVRITCKLAQDKDYQLTESAQCYLEDDYAHQPSLQGNGRLARNVLEDAILHQAARLAKDPDADLTLLEVADFADKKTES